MSRTVIKPEIERARFYVEAWYFPSVRKPEEIMQKILDTAYELGIDLAVSTMPFGCNNSEEKCQR